MFLLERTEHKPKATPVGPGPKGITEYAIRVTRELLPYLKWPRSFGKAMVWDGISIEAVDGGKVKVEKFMDFVEGGHDVVYNFIPKKTIWIDGRLDISQRGFVLLHELVERKMMGKHGMSYSKAHPISNHYEKLLRMGRL